MFSPMILLKNLHVRCGQSKKWMERSISILNKSIQRWHWSYRNLIPLQIYICGGRRGWNWFWKEYFNPAVEQKRIIGFKRQPTTRHSPMKQPTLDIKPKIKSITSNCCKNDQISLIWEYYRISGNLKINDQIKHLPLVPKSGITTAEH